MYRTERIKAIVKRIKEEKSKGGTFEEISKKFNKDNFPTIYGKEWTGRNLFNYFQKHK